MKYPQFHIPRWRHSHAHDTSAHPHHHHQPAEKFQKAEGIIDYLIVAGVVLLGAAMVFGLLTSQGESPWF